jgi:hypothetical protein
MAMFQREDDAATAIAPGKWNFSRVEWVQRDTQSLPHQSVGGSRGYDIHLNHMMLEAYQSG